MRLSDLADGYEISGTLDPDVSGLSEDSRRITPGMLFVALRGTAEDGHRYITDAVDRGAVAVAAESVPSTFHRPWVRLRNPRADLAALAARFFDFPARELTMIGFTGTFGKTSASAVLRELLEAGGSNAGVVGSLGAHYGDFSDPGRGLTTPAPVELHGALRGLKAAGADTVVVEVTSHALLLGRVSGVWFDGGLISAIKPGEHSDFHGSYQDYVAAKRRFLDHLAPAGVLAFDADNHAARLLGKEAPTARKAGVSLHGRETDVRLLHIGLDYTGARFTIGGRKFHSPLLGRGNLKNVALALAYAFACGMTAEQVRPALKRLKPLPRRMEHFTIDGRVVLDDTAGHPESLRATFDVANMLGQSPGLQDAGRMVVVYAVRGNRGADINARNAVAIADLAAEHGAHRLLVTASSDVAGPNDRASSAEIDAARAAFASRYQAFDWFDDLEGAARAAIDASRTGDLIVLVGAQGMNEGRRLLSSAGTSPRT